MSIGKFRDRVNIWAVTQGDPDGMGGFATVKTLATTVWAKVEQKTSARITEGNAIVTSNFTNITMRTGAFQVTTGNILELNGVEFTINGITTDPLKRWTICNCGSDGR